MNEKKKKKHGARNMFVGAVVAVVALILAPLERCGINFGIGGNGGGFESAPPAVTAEHTAAETPEATAEPTPQPTEITRKQYVIEIEMARVMYDGAEVSLDELETLLAELVVSESEFEVLLVSAIKDTQEQVEALLNEKGFMFSVIYKQQ